MLRVQAMIMLGVNCGFGTADVGTLPKSAIDLKSGWVNYPRPKTEMDRRCPLWSETIQAIERANQLCPSPRRPEFAGLVFLNPCGGQWANGRQTGSTLSHDIRRLVRIAGIDAGNGRGFYALRRTFETIGSEALDQAAVDLIMGHCPRADDMAAVYRQRIGDDRLLAVTEHVRRWLFPSVRENYFAQRREIAAGFAQEWIELAGISSDQIRQAIAALRISQTELARSIGVAIDTINRIVRDRKPASEIMKSRLLAFMQQLAEGKPPSPVERNRIHPVIEKPSDVVLSDEAAMALLHVPFTHVELGVLVDCLAASGVTQVKLAKWWGYCGSYYRYLRNSRKPIPARGADRLRVLFGLPSLLPVVEESAVKTREPGKIPIPPEIAALFDREPFESAELKVIINYLRRECGITQTAVCGWLNISTNHLDCMLHRNRSVKIRSALRGMFATEGGAT
jgi:plasmid maintenance system antidote protein VapI